MKWLTKYFNKKVNNEDLFLNHLKSTYDFDEVCIIKKMMLIFLKSLELLQLQLLFVTTDLLVYQPSILTAFNNLLTRSYQSVIILL